MAAVAGSQRYSATPPPRRLRFRKPSSPFPCNRFKAIFAIFKSCTGPWTTPSRKSSSTWRPNRWCDKPSRIPSAPIRPMSSALRALLESVRQCPSVRAVVVVTTDKCYENRDWDWAYREVDPLGGSDPYSSSKACMELVVRSFRDSFFSANPVDGRRVGVASARAGNMIGGGDWAKDRLVPDMMRSFAAGRPVMLRNPQARRPWQFVLEALRGYMLLAQGLYEDAGSYAGAWNFGPNRADVRPVQWIVERLAAGWGAEAKWDLQGGSHPQETPDADAGLFQGRCGTCPGLPYVNLSDALEMTAEWYRGFYAGKNIAEIYAAADRCLFPAGQYKVGRFFSRLARSVTLRERITPEKQNTLHSSLCAPHFPSP